MKKSDILKHLKSGDHLYWSDWGGRSYRFFKAGGVNGTWIRDLIDKGFLVSYKSKNGLSGQVKLKNNEITDSL